MYNRYETGFLDPITTQEEFNERVNGFMDRGEEEALLALLEQYPDFMVRYAVELEKELGL